ncbi:hypothetical protein GCM10025794_19010 [Massilia kyonggiensis]
MEKILPRESHRPTEFLETVRMRKTFQPVVSYNQASFKGPSQRLLELCVVNMKRKLDANDVPSTEVEEEKNTKDADNTDFESLNLDPRLRQALIKEQFTKPTPVQSKAIPLALEGKDILGKHRASVCAMV